VDLYDSQAEEEITQGLYQTLPDDQSTWDASFPRPDLACRLPPFFNRGCNRPASKRQKVCFENATDVVDVKVGERIIQTPNAQRSVRVLIEGLELTSFFSIVEGARSAGRNDTQTAAQYRGPMGGKTELRTLASITPLRIGSGKRAGCGKDIWWKSPRCKDGLYHQTWKSRRERGIPTFPQPRRLLVIYSKLKTRARRCCSPNGT
jgi:hypothetical protein